MSDLIDRNFMLSQIEKARAENKTFDYDSLIDFVKVLPRVDQTSELKKIKAEIQDLDLGFVDEEYQAGVAYGIMKFNQILDKHIKGNEQ